ncbi:hypothetical protein OG558_03635 [Kribbella sp. NBC_01510]|uniref:hypothetical protein n=1 Tax=Kribbella sp. NBC_01510 TaxID=2903581 RepID=UPI0038647360
MPYATNSASTVKARWHNQKFAELAAELRLDATKDSRIGWSTCTLRKETSTTCQSVIADLKKALIAYRHPETTGGQAKKKNNNAIACACQCPFRVAKSSPRRGRDHLRRLRLHLRSRRVALEIHLSPTAAPVVLPLRLCAGQTQEFLWCWAVGGQEWAGSTGLRNPGRQGGDRGRRGSHRDHNHSLESLGRGSVRCLNRHLVAS